MQVVARRSSSGVDAAQVQAAKSQLGTDGLEVADQVRRAAAREEFQAAIALLLAGASNGRLADAALLANVLPGTESLSEFLTVIVACDGDRPAVLVDLVERDGFDANPAFGMEQAALALYSARHLPAGE